MIARCQLPILPFHIPQQKIHNHITLQISVIIHKDNILMRARQVFHQRHIDSLPDADDDEVDLLLLHIKLLPVEQFISHPGVSRVIHNHKRNIHLIGSIPTQVRIQVLGHEPHGSEEVCIAGEVVGNRYILDLPQGVVLVVLGAERTESFGILVEGDNTNVGSVAANVELADEVLGEILDLIELLSGVVFGVYQDAEVNWCN